MLILVVDDHELNRSLMTALLDSLGHEVVTAVDGHLAIEAVREQAFDFVFMDVRMPTMDGVEATRRIRALGEEFQALPIIALTADANREDEQRCHEAGMSGFLGKPIIIPDLVKALEKHSLRN